MRAAPILASLALASAVLTGCGGPSPTRLVMTLSASPQLNPNSDNQPSPTMVTIYDLKSATTFTNASFDGLFYNGATTLGADLLAQKQLAMLPGKTISLKDEAAPGTRFVGVVAGFRAPQGDAWRGLLAVAPKERNKIAITLAPSSVTIAKPPSGGWF